MCAQGIVREGENYGLLVEGGEGGVHCAVYLCIPFLRGIFGWEGFKSLPVCVPIFYGSEGFLVGVEFVTMSS